MPRTYDPQPPPVFTARFFGLNGSSRKSKAAMPVPPGNCCLQVWLPQAIVTVLVGGARARPDKERDRLPELEPAASACSGGT
mmetsp:Transcript_94913/g.306401  ORF Transcript_94913/g.306401 Transcript_94913/m.306401 type:complete len:82 (-) Transcript_94913:93-338(-)